MRVGALLQQQPGDGHAAVDDSEMPRIIRQSVNGTIEQDLLASALQVAEHIACCLEVATPHEVHEAALQEVVIHEVAIKTPVRLEEEHLALQLRLQM